MKADDVLAAGIDVLLDQFGEDIDYSAHEGGEVLTVKAVVDPNPLTDEGQLLNTIIVTVARSAVPGLSLKESRFYYVEEADSNPERYVVHRIMSKDANHFDLLCVK